MIKENKNSTTVLLKVYDDDTEFTRCNYAFVTLTQDLLETISKLRKGRDQLGCYEVTEFNFACTFLDQDEFSHEIGDKNISDELEEALEEFTSDNAGAWRIDPLGEVEELRVSETLLHVSDYGVKFTGYGKFSGVKYNTEKISFDIIDSLEPSKDKKCNNCDGMILELDEECPDCGRKA